MPSNSNTQTEHVSGQANTPMSKPAHALSSDAVVDETQANAIDGLTSQEARRRLEQYGRNELGSADGVSPLKIFARQVANAMTLVLILAMGVSFGIQSWIEGGVIGAVILLNISIGFYNEFKAEKTMDSLRQLSSPTAHAVRDGKTQVIPTVEIVPGDLVEMKHGDTVPADVRLIEAVNFESDEALLTGESLPARKDASEILDDATGPGDRTNVAFASATVSKGRAKGVVFATGRCSEVGSIAAALSGKKSRRRPVKRNEDGNAKPYRYAEAGFLTVFDGIGRFLGVNVGTPLQRLLSQLAIYLFGVAIIFAIVVLAANNFRSEQEVIIYAVATGLAMIPASLIVVLTITMSAGTKRMVDKNVIVRNLRSLEALGGITDICSDKTGTLTQGKMIVRKAWVAGKGTYSAIDTRDPFNPTEGTLRFEAAQPSDTAELSTLKSESAEQLLKDNTHLHNFLNIASLANLADVHAKREGGWAARGDPTEIAIQVFASRFDYNRHTLRDRDGWEQLAEFPFDSDVKKMSVIFEHKSSGNKHVFTKGAVERILSSCVSIFWNTEGTKTELTEEHTTKILANMETLASQGLRVLALASREFKENPENFTNLERSEVEKDLTFHGLVGIYDPPRPESAHSVRQCQRAGIEVHMLTGDHPGTATAIAKEVGILPQRMGDLSKEVSDSMVFTAAEFDKLSDADVDALPVLPLVIARCAPSTKVRMIEALHRRKRYAAMTGDGVNDSPSLKEADVGIGMGTGSDVAKDASDIVLTDDNFASILNAIEEGRRMFDNIQKFILHLLAQNIALAVVLLVGLAFKDERSLSVFPVSPVEIMWIIMVTSSLPDMGLGFEREAPGIMERPPHDNKRGVFTTEVILDMIVYGFWVAILCVLGFVIVLYGVGDGDLGIDCNNTYSSSCDLAFRARATCFGILTWLSLFLAWELTDMRRSFFSKRPSSGRRESRAPKPAFYDAALPTFMVEKLQNRFLSASVLGGFVTLFPLLYIPGLNEVVFKHTGISYEWGIIFGAVILFFAGTEAWKYAKRVYYRRQDAKRNQDEREAPGAWPEKGLSRVNTEFSKGSANQSGDLA